jgi:threonine/homoserine/homoserine lactone efflux protein
MFGFVIKGIILGAVISISLGPAFFAIIQTGITKGFRFGAFMAAGILFSDLILITISYLIGATLFEDPLYKIYMGIIGGIILIIFGSVTWAKKPDILKQRQLAQKHAPYTPPSPLGFAAKGFFMNIMNPFLYIFWFGAISFVAKSAEEGKLLQSSILFFSGTLGTVFALDLIKSYLGGRIKKFMKPRIELYINKGVGITLVVFGVVLIFRTLHDAGFFDHVIQRLS